MGPAERRNAIMKILCRRRFETMPKLAEEFGVSARTIQRDIEVLSLTEPIYTQAGRHGGGVYVMEGYTIDRLYMTEEEVSVMKKMLNAIEQKSFHGITLQDEELLIEIVRTYTKPIARKDK